MPQVSNVQLVGTAASDKVSVTWDDVDGAAMYIVRWGENQDGVLDDNMFIVKGDNQVDITEHIPASGKKMDVYVGAFHSNYATTDEAMRSSEYSFRNAKGEVWSELLIVDIP